MNYGEIRFFSATNKDEWRTIGEIYMQAHCQMMQSKVRGIFKGAFVGIACQDLLGINKYTDFDYFSYIE